MGRIFQWVIPLVAVMCVLAVGRDAQAQTRFFVRVGPPVRLVAPAPVYVPPPLPRLVWQPGYYVWTGWDYRWVPGAWVQARYPRVGARYLGPRWRPAPRWRGPRGGFYVSGSWLR